MNTNQLVAVRDSEVSPAVDLGCVALGRPVPVLVDKELAGLVQHADPADVSRLLILVYVDVLDSLVRVKLHTPVGLLGRLGCLHVRT